jgi:hypothetical protein
MRVVVLHVKIVTCSSLMLSWPDRCSTALDFSRAVCIAMAKNTSTSAKRRGYKEIIYNNAKAHVRLKERAMSSNVARSVISGCRMPAASTAGQDAFERDTAYQ